MPTLMTSKTGEDGAHTDWPIHFESVSWAYESPNFKAKFKAPYRRSKLLQSRAIDTDIGTLERGLELNYELVGVAAAVDVLCAYEENSGFHYKFGGDHSETVSDISREIDDDDVVLSRENWDDITQNLTGDFSEDGSDSSSLASSLVLDSSDWEMPSTPKPPHLSPSHSSPSRLSASASSFTPSLTFSAATKSSPSPVPDFVFPSLNSSYPKLKIEKDEQGFFTNIKTDADEITPKTRMHSSSLLPAFLQDDSRRKTSSSRTRTLVDKLRSKQSIHDRSGYSPSPSPVSDGGSSKSRSLSRCSTPPPVFFADNQDGWIGIDESPPPQAHKSFSRHHRTESGLVAAEVETVDHSPSSPLSQTGTSSSSSTSSSDSWSSMPRTPPAANKDGWISLLPSAQTKRGKRKAEKVASMSAANALDILTFPSLNDKPPPALSARPSRSRTRSSSAKPKATAPVIFPPGPTPAPYYSYPTVAIPVSVAYTMAPLVPYPAVPHQYHRTPHQAYPHQLQQPHTHPQPSHHYPTYHHHSRAHSLAVPPPTMPGYVSKPSYMVPNPSPMMPGVW